MVRRDGEVAGTDELAGPGRGKRPGVRIAARPFSLSTTFLSSGTSWTRQRSLASLSEGRSPVSPARRFCSSADGFRSPSPLLSSEPWGGCFLFCPRRTSTTVMARGVGALPPLGRMGLRHHWNRRCSRKHCRVGVGDMVSGGRRRLLVLRLSAFASLLLLFGIFAAGIGH